MRLHSQGSGKKNQCTAISKIGKYENLSNIYYQKCLVNCSSWMKIIPNRNSDIQEGIKNIGNGK